MFQFVPMFKLAAAVGFLLVLGGANGNWIVDKNDASFEGLEFTAWNLECNDAKTECSKCYTALPYGGAELVLIHAFEYTKDPYMFRYTTQFAHRDWEVSFVQNDASERFHYCVEMNDLATDITSGWSLHMCLENDFTGLTVPPECSTPVVAIRTFAGINDRPLSGQQTLYCLP